jgi:hypothetical protein
MPETRTYSGGCHCGAVRFEVETDLSSVAGVRNPVQGTKKQVEETLGKLKALAESG